MNLVRHYAFPDRYALHVDTTTIRHGESLDGIVPWRIKVKGAAARHVDFLIDGEVVWRDSRRPFVFAAGRGWNTTQVANGTHTLAVRVTGDGLSAWQRLQVRVENRDLRPDDLEASPMAEGEGPAPDPRQRAGRKDDGNRAVCRRQGDQPRPRRAVHAPLELEGRP